MTGDSGPFDIDTTRLVFGPQGLATPVAVTPSFYEDLGHAFGGFAGHMLICRHSFETAWPAWEMHPKGDEFVLLLDGDADFVLWFDTGERLIRVDRPGNYVIVPRGTWHTVRPRQQTTMLFVTPGEGTQNAETPPGYNP